MCLLQINAGIVKGLTEAIGKHAPEVSMCCSTSTIWCWQHLRSVMHCGYRHGAAGGKRPSDSWTADLCRRW